MDIKILKAKAKESLSDNFSEALLVVLISGLISIPANLIIEYATNINNFTMTIIGELLAFLINGLITFGSLSFYLKLSRNENVEFNELFKKTDMLSKYIILSLLVGLFTALWSILFIIPGIIAAISYSQAMLITLDNPEMDALSAIRKSKELMNGHKLDYLLLNLSFLGWLILGLFTLGILYLWLIPYITITQMNFYNALLEENK